MLRGPGYRSCGASDFFDFFHLWTIVRFFVKIIRGVYFIFSFWKI